ESRDADPAQNVQGNLRTNSADVVDQKPEQLAFRRAHKTVQDVRVFTDGEMRQQSDFLPRLWELVKGGQRDERFIADAVYVHRYLRRQGVDQSAMEKADHCEVFKSFSRGSTRSAIALAHGPGP